MSSSRVVRLLVCALAMALLTGALPFVVAADPRVHRVRQGDTLVRIARRYGVAVRVLQTANGLGRRSHLAIGQELVIPEGDEPVTPAALGELRQRRERGRATALAARLGIGGTRMAQGLLTQPPSRRWVRAAGRGRLAGTLMFPVPRGWWGRGWGSGRGGYHLAVDMPGPSGSPVRAAERGLVVYADNGVHGYGNLVMIVHSNGWVTAYAHNSRFRVVAGEKVRRGQRIADLGSTGISRGPHCHFMLIYGGEHCDPTPLFRPAARHRGGRRLTVRTTRWTDRNPPAAIRCLPRSARPFPRGGEDASDAPGEDVESGEGEQSGNGGSGGHARRGSGETASPSEGSSTEPTGGPAEPAGAADAPPATPSAPAAPGSTPSAP